MAKVYTKEQMMTRCQCEAVLMFEPGLAVDPRRPETGAMTSSRTVDGVTHTVDKCGVVKAVKK